MTTFPEPYEGITGTDRDDLLLSLDVGALPHREALIAMTLHLYSAVLIGNPPPRTVRMYERITHPEPGDLVVETTTARRGAPAERVKGLGVLLADREEWAWTLDVHQAQLAKEQESCARDGVEFVPWDRSTERVTYIQFGPAAGDICRWTNCQFITAPVDGFDHPTMGRTITRESLLGYLGDAGFEVDR